MLEILPRASLAAEQGAGALMLAPGLCGFDALRLLASRKGPGLPILCHPALLGSFTAGSDSGLSHGLAYGLLPRFWGADASIFPNYGGRFSFSQASCREIAHACLHENPGLPASFPVPAGGMTLERVGEMVSFYGNDAMLLIGGDLRRHGELSASCREFVCQVQSSLANTQNGPSRVESRQPR
jgi:ribulose-bisphosphate carboxylase large chain